MHAELTIKNGFLKGLDSGGCEWSGNLQFLENNSLDVNVQLDASQAPSDTFLHDKQGQPTRATQNYKGTLKVLKVGESLTIFGDVKHGVFNVTVNLVREGANG